MEKSRSKAVVATRNQSGVAAIFVVMILMTVLALISVGFSQLMNREVRQSLDRQLSVEAFYAAESGVNDARNYLTSGPATSFTGCATPADNNFVTGGNISGDNLAKYTCTVVDTTPPQLNYPLNAGESISIKLDLPALATLHLGWENQSYDSAGAKPMTTTGGPSPLGTLPREDEIVKDSTGLLRIGLYPVSTTAAASGDINATLASASRNYFLYPTAGDGSEGTVPFDNASSNGTFVSGNCNSTHPNGYLPYTKGTDRYCNSAVTNLNKSDGVTYYLRLTALYEPIGLSIQTSDTSGNYLRIPGAEGIIDVTGSGNDVLKRVQALVPIGDNFDYPGYGLQSMQAVCKLFRVDVVGPSQYGNTTTDSAPNDDGACATPLNGAFIEGGGLGSLGDIPCPSGYVGNYPDCVVPPPPPPPPSPPPCNVSVAGSHRNPDGTVTVTAQAGGCGYYTNNLVGGNGGGVWGPSAEPPNFTFCQQGGTDPWGYYAIDCITI